MIEGQVRYTRLPQGFEDAFLKVLNSTHLKIKNRTLNITYRLSQFWMQNPRNTQISEILLENQVPF